MSSTPLTDAVEKYIQVKTDTGDWGKSSLKTTHPVLREFVELVEHIRGEGCPSLDVDRDTARDYCAMIHRLPTKRKIKTAFHHKGLASLLKMKVPRTDLPSPKTIKNKFTVVRSFLTWAEDEDYVGKAGALKRAIKDPKQEVKAGQSTVSSFTLEDLELLFCSKEYRTDSHHQAYQHWLPLLGLFIGARIEELCQLHLDDIKQEGEV